jgi:phosphoribosylaminoimidazole (AIR) synthetase
VDLQDVVQGGGDSRGGGMTLGELARVLRAQARTTFNMGTGSAVLIATALKVEDVEAALRNLLADESLYGAIHQHIEAIVQARDAGPV